MKDYTMDQYTLQSYFKSLCKSFYIAYKQVKRLEEKQKEIEATNPQDELKTVNMLLRNHESLKKLGTIVQVCSEEELEQKKEQLENLKSVYEKKCEELEGPKKFWSGRLWNDCAINIEHVIESIKKRNYTIIVTSKEEVFALMAFFRENSVEVYRIINVEEDLSCFPTDDMSKEFLEAYISCNADNMDKICKKYF